MQGKSGKFAFPNFGKLYYNQVHHVIWVLVIAWLLQGVQLRSEAGALQRMRNGDDLGLG